MIFYPQKAERSHVIADSLWEEGENEHLAELCEHVNQSSVNALRHAVF
jgi:hypothetical protein